MESQESGRAGERLIPPGRTGNGMERRLARTRAERISESSAGRVFSGAFLQGISALVYGLTIVLVARQVGPAAFGQLAIGVMISLVGRDAIDFGRSSLLTRMQAHCGVCTAPLARGTLRRKAVASPLLLLPLLGAGWLGEGGFNPVMILFWPYAVATSLSQTLMAPMMGAAQLGRASGFVVKERLVSLAAVWLCLPWLGTAAFPLGLTVGATVVCWLLRDPGWNQSGAEMEQREFSRQARPFGVTSLTTDAQYLDVALVTALAGAATGGVFAAASRLTNPLAMVIFQASALILARASAGAARMRAVEAVRVVAALAVIYLPTLLLLAWQADWLVAHMLGAEYAQAGHVMRILLCGVAIGVVGFPLGAWMNATGRSTIVAATCVATVVLYFAVIATGSLMHDPTVIGIASPLMYGATLFVLGAFIVTNRLRRRRRRAERRDVGTGASRGDRPGRLSDTRTS